MRKIKLRPCPFCGRAALGKTAETYYSGARYVAGCYNKECEIQPETFSHNTPEEAAAVWNGTRNGEEKNDG